MYGSTIINNDNSLKGCVVKKTFVMDDLVVKIIHHLIYSVYNSKQFCS